MDPSVALTQLLRALLDGDVSGAREHFADLDEWLSRGGMAPRPPECARCGRGETDEP